jgi:hypothetical protein
MNRTAAAILTALGIVILALAVSYAVLLAWSGRSLARAYAALEKDGRPMTAEDLVPPEIPDTENAALVYESVVLQLKAQKADQGDLFSRLSTLAGDMLDDSWTSNNVRTFRLLMQSPEAARALHAIQEGASKPGCRYNLDYSQGAGILLPHLNDLRHLSRILCVSARLQAEGGDGPAAWRTTLTALRFANALQAEPLLISQLVRIAQFSLADDAVHAVCRTAVPTPEVSGQLGVLLRAFDDMAPFVASMDGERLLLGEWAFNLPRSQLRQSGLPGRGSLGITLLAFSPLLKRDHAAYLEIMHEYARMARRPHSPKDAGRGAQMLLQVPKYCIFTRLLAPALSKAKARYIEMTAKARTTQAGLAVLTYARNRGAYPESLAACGAQALTDPFTGKALLYRAFDDGFLVYSAGRNQKDDGGTGERTRDVTRDDVGWRHRRPTSSLHEN